VRPTAVLALLLFPGPVAADDYLLVFAADATPYRGVRAHTFAAVVRVEADPDGVARAADVTSLSWLPATKVVRPLAVHPEPGRNVPLDETLRDYLAAGGRVSLWGPYRVRPELADAFRARVADVEARHLYKAGALFDRRTVVECARGVEETIRGGERRRYVGVFGFGDAASSEVVRKFTPWLVEPHQTHPRVASAIGLDAYPIVRRSHGDYATRRDQLRSAFRRP
jgi:hypothetical protein